MGVGWGGEPTPSRQRLTEVGCVGGESPRPTLPGHYHNSYSMIFSSVTVYSSHKGQFHQIVSYNNNNNNHNNKASKQTTNKQTNEKQNYDNKKETKVQTHRYDNTHSPSQAASTRSEI